MGSLLRAQVIPVPVVPPPGSSYPGQLVSHPDSAANLMQLPGQADLAQVPPPAAEPTLPMGARPGMFQKLILEGAWLPWDGGDNIGFSDLELKTVLALPLPSRQAPLLVTPGFGVHYLDGPVSADLPPRVYDAYMQFRWMGSLAPQFGVDLAVTPGVYSDFQRWSGDAFRVTGHGAAMWGVTPDFRIVLGAAYIDRQTADVLPIAGFVWTPNEDTKFELVFPNPRIAERLYWDGACTPEIQDWIYLGAELGGGTWAVEQAGDLAQQIDYRDYRIFIGLERKAVGCLSSRLEIGYVFGRKLQFEDDTPDIEPEDTVMLRAAVSY